MRRWQFWAMCICLLALTGCKALNCGGDDDGGGDTKAQNERPIVHEDRLANEMALFFDERRCEPGAIVAKGRNGHQIDLCGDIEHAKRYALVPAEALGRFYKVKQLPVEEWIKAFHEKTFGLFKSSDTVQHNEREARMAKWTADVQATSIYWGILRRDPYFLNRYVDGRAYPEPGTKAFAEELEAGDALAKGLAPPARE